MKPKLKVLLNQDLDVEVCRKFLYYKNGGVDFGKGIKRVHPNLKEDRIEEYFSEYYKSNSLRLNEVAIKNQKDWDRIEAKFYGACDKYFENNSWPTGSYEAYLSIIDCNPRFVENKTFQVYWRHRTGFVGVSVHEMLHFLFYDLVLKLMPNIDLKNKYLWKISEIFNDLIMREPEFLEIAQSKSLQYPALLGMQEKLRSVWNSNKNANNFIKETILKY